MNSVIKNFAKLLSCLALTLAAAHHSYAAFMEEGKNIIAEKGKVRLEKKGKRIFLEDFSGKTHKLIVGMNYYNRVSITPGEKNGRRALLIKPEQFKSQAWGIHTKPIPVKAGNEFLISFDVAGSVSMLKGAGRKRFSNRYYFLDKEKKQTGDDVYFYYESRSPRFLTHKLHGKAPENAAYLIVQFGGAPRLKAGEELAYGKLEIFSADQNTLCAGKGSFISRPILAAKGDVLKRKGTIPKGCRIDFEVQSAPMVKGRAGKWSSWKKYTGGSIVSAESFVRYKAILTGSGKNSPILTEVSIGSTKDSCWDPAPDQAPPQIKRISPSPTQNAKGKVVFLLSDDSAPDFSKVKCIFNKKDITGKLKRRGYTYTYTPEQPLKNGLNAFKFSLEDIYGNKHTLSDHVFVGSAFAGNKITFRKDGLMRINGKEFFPIGFFSSKYFMDTKKTDAILAKFAAGGINFMQSYMGRGEGIKVFLDSAEKHAIKVCMRYWLYEHRNHKAAIGYFIADDSNRFTPAALQSMYNGPKAAAPGLFGAHTVWPLQSYTSLYRSRVRSTDTFIPQLYPISDKWASIRNGPQRIITDIKTCLRDRVEMGRPDQPVLPLLQTFSDKNIWTRYPTKDELRLMSYLAVIHGGNGVLYFSMESAMKGSNNYLDMVLAITRELKELYPVLLVEKREKTPVVKILSGPEYDSDKNPAVNIMVKKMGAYTYIFAANSAKKKVKGSFMNMEKGSAEVLFEKRSIKFNGALTDTFAPYAVHIYRIRTGK